MRPEVRTEIHAELHPNVVAGFRQQYKALTGGVALPAATNVEPFYVWPEGVNKYGRQLRIYFRNVARFRRLWSGFTLTKANGTRGENPIASTTPAWSFSSLSAAFSSARMPATKSGLPGLWQGVSRLWPSPSWRRLTNTLCG